MKPKVEERNIKPNEYQTIRKTTGWDMLSDEVVSKGLKNDLYSVCVFDENKLIGIGRIVGDGAIYFYIQDIIVIPEYKGKGIGKLIMQHIEDYLNKTANHNSFIGLMAAIDVQKFYHQFGYTERPDSKPGMYKMIRKEIIQ